ncbi:MAG: hypothetical protein JNM08_03895 [Rubrivivax sp.]|nr:hypothetical protein [Rubrivivax sp.]
MSTLPALPPYGRSEAFPEDLEDHLSPPPAPPAPGAWASVALVVPVVVAMASVLLP